MLFCFFVFFFKQKTAYEMRISDWSSDVCSSDLDDAVIAALAEPLDDRLIVDLARPRLEPPGIVPDLDVGNLVPATVERRDQVPGQIGRASCRERVCQYV